MALCVCVWVCVSTKKNGMFTVPLVLTYSLIEWDDSSNFPFYSFGFLCYDPLLFSRPCTSLSHTQFFAALSRCRRPLRLLELLLGDCPMGMCVLPYYLSNARQQSTHWCSDGVIFFFFCPLRRSLGRLGRWARQRKCVLMPDTVSSHENGPYIRTLSTCLSADATKLFSSGLLYATFLSCFSFPFFFCVRGCFWISPSGLRL